MQRKKLTDLEVGDLFIYHKWGDSRVVAFNGYYKLQLGTIISFYLPEEQFRDEPSDYDTADSYPKKPDEIYLDVLDPDDEYEIENGEVVILSAEDV